TLGPTHDATVGTMHRLAGHYLCAGSLGESITWYETTFNAAQDPKKLSLNGYARALQGAGRLEEADCQLRKALDLACGRRDRRARERQTALVQKILGPNLLLQGRYAEAEAVTRAALAVLEKETPDHWSRFHAMSVVGGALLGEKRYTEAEPFLVQ